MKDRLAYSADNCSLMRTLEIVGERWTLLVLREALLGLRRFDDLQRALGCARNVLASRLTKLVERGILERAPYREPGSRAREEYRLTETGAELTTAVVALMRWGDRHVADRAGAPLALRHRGWGKAIRAQLACAVHGDVPPAEVEVRAGPGAKRVA